MIFTLGYQLINPQTTNKKNPDNSGFQIFKYKIT